MRERSRVPLRMDMDTGALRPPTRATACLAATRRTPATRCAFTATTMFAVTLRAAIVRSTDESRPWVFVELRVLRVSREWRRAGAHARDTVSETREMRREALSIFLGGDFMGP